MRQTHLTAGFAAAALAAVVTGAWAAPKPTGRPMVKAPTAKPAAQTTGPAQPAPPPDFEKLAPMASSRALALLQSSAVTFTNRQDCLSCHHQLITAVVVDAARRYGFKVDEAAARTERANLARNLEMLKPLALAGTPATDKQLDHITVDPMATMGYVMAALQSSGFPRDEVTGGLALYMGRKQREDGRFAVLAGRPPSEASDFMATALGIRALKAYGPESHAGELADRIARARAWLTGARARNAEDRAFRLLGLAWSGAPAAAVAAAKGEILEHQQDDGGWAQLPGMGTDAYATGLTLWALREGTGMAADEPVYMRGYVYLLFRQRPDGSWHVVSRAQPVQPYFESGFPHKKDQFISSHATAFAALALMPVAPPSGAAPVAAR